MHVQQEGHSSSNKILNPPTTIYNSSPNNPMGALINS